MGLGLAFEDHVKKKPAEQTDQDQSEGKEKHQKSVISLKLKEETFSK